MRATAQNKTHFEDQRAQLEASNLKRRQDAEAVAGKLNGLGVALIRQAGESGQLYGSVSVKDIVDGLVAQDAKVTKGMIVLERPIKTLGIFGVKVVLHPEVSVNVQVNVARSDDEAELQKDGVNVLDQMFEAEQAEIAAEAIEAQVEAEVASDAADAAEAAANAKRREEQAAAKAAAEAAGLSAEASDDA
jgi:large subunit ribosomal protein L9